MAEKENTIPFTVGTQMRCPQCGLVANGVRCLRCNSVKLVACTGACRVCKMKCG